MFVNNLDNNSNANGNNNLNNNGSFLQIIQAQEMRSIYVQKGMKFPFCTTQGFYAYSISSSLLFGGRVFMGNHKNEVKVFYFKI